MRIRSLFGPVFGLETLLAARRWQIYVGRSLFVGLLLACLSTVWSVDYSKYSYEQAQQRLAIAGDHFHRLIVIAEITLILLAAPAATAGAICLDKSRGSLTHLLTTHLTAKEIVLGKLGARLLPILGILACALPVSIIATFLGGVDPQELFSDFLVCVGLAVLGCTLTTFVSVWGTKPHEVLGVVYTVWAIWLLPWIFLESVNAGGKSTILDLIRPFNPFWVTFGGGAVMPRSPEMALAAGLQFLLEMLAISVLFAFLAVKSLRPAALKAADHLRKPVVESKVVRRFRRDVPWWPSPSLDKNPVLWREWHRNRPTRWTRIVWGIYLGIAGISSASCILGNLGLIPFDARELSPFVVAGTASLGFLLMSVTAATSLAEERVRGSLDVLLATPLSTASIIGGKWRGTFRLTPLVLFWPILVCYSQVIHILPDVRVFLFYVILIYGFAWGAFVTSLGLALACWTKRLGRALGLSVAIYVGLTLFSPLMLSSREDLESWMASSAFLGTGVLSAYMGERLGEIDDPSVIACLIWSAVYGISAGLLYLAVRLSFNHAMGRASDRPRRPRLDPTVLTSGIRHDTQPPIG